MKLLRNRQKSGMEYLYENYSAALYGTIFRIVQNEEIGSEVLQDTFLKIWNKFDQYDKKKGRLFTWMINIARNLAIDKTRSAEIKHQQKSDKVEDNVHIIDHQKFDTMAVDGIGLEKILQKLNVEHRKIIELMYYKGYTQTEIAEEFNIPLGTVKTRSRTALLQLRKLLS